VKRNKVLWIGLSLYVVSFFLIAVKGYFVTIGMHGFDCALNTLIGPWERDATFDGHSNFLAYLISGWINPVFLITAVLISLGRLHRVMTVLRIAVLLMIPFCWVVFHYEMVYPREGHFVWIIGMLLVLFSGEIAKSGKRSGMSSD
jgi:hypothetical protein